MTRLSQQSWTQSEAAQGSGQTSDGKLLLAAAFVSGVFGGLVFKLLGLHPFLTAGFSACVLSAYAWLAYAGTSLRREPEMIGDNSYYLGFLLTLTSLAVTLYFIVEATPETRGDLIPEVISGFGVALVSTIVGVFIRVLMMQFRSAPLQPEAGAQSEVDEAARRLRVELAQALARVKDFTVESLQLAAERDARIRSATDSLVQTAHTNLAQTSETVRQSLSQTSEAIRQDFAQISASIRQDFAQTASAIGREIGATARAQSAAAADEIRLAVQASAQEALFGMRTAFEETTIFTEEIRQANASTREASQAALESARDQSREMVDQIARIGGDLQDLSQTTAAAGAEFSERVRFVSSEFAQAIDDSQRRLSESAGRFEKAATEAADSVSFIAWRIKASVEAEEADPKMKPWGGPLPSPSWA